MGQATIVVVDDTDYVREILELMLGQKGYKVYSFANPEDALAVAETIRIDVFVVDMVMPNLDGLEVLRRLKVKEKPYEAIMITGNSNNDDAAEATRLGAFGILKKPFTFDEFITSVEYALSSASAKKQQMSHLLDSAPGASAAHL
jgi:DNA-binding NtrC family response regulator